MTTGALVVDRGVNMQQMTKTPTAPAGAGQVLFAHAAAIRICGTNKEQRTEYIKAQTWITSGWYCIARHN